MPRYAFRMSSSPSIIVEIIALAQSVGAQTSAPQPTSSTADPLNAPIAGGELQAAAQVVTVVFSAGTAVAKFFATVLEIVEKRNARIMASRAQEQQAIQIRTQDDVDKISRPKE